MKSPALSRFEDILATARGLVAAQKATERASAARRDLPAGSPRARVTTANARWAGAAEARDRLEERLRALVEASSLPPTWTRSATATEAIR